MVPRLAQMLAGFRNKDPPTVKKLPIGIDIPEYISLCSLRPDTSEHTRTTADLILIAFYYLLRVGEYTAKGSRQNTKRTVQFRLRDITFFKRDSFGVTRQLSRAASDFDINNADSATLKLDNQKNGWKGVCIHQEANGDSYHCPVKALGRRYVHLRQFSTDTNTQLSTYYTSTHMPPAHVSDKDIRGTLKLAGIALEYPAKKGIPIDRIDTHSLRSGGANALSLSGYSDTEIQKMGRWRSATFKEYIREELNIFSSGMTRDMRRHFNFVNIAGGVYHDVTNTIISRPYTPDLLPEL